MHTLSTVTSALVLSIAAASCSPGNARFTAPTEVPPARPELVARFDATANELPEGFVLTEDAAYVGFAPTSRVVRVDTATGATTPFGQLPAPVPGKGFMTGLARSTAGDVYAGLASFVPDVQAGIYRIPKSGGAAALFARDDALALPNALAFDTDGALFVTDSASGTVFRIDAEGRAERWATGSALMGDKDACGAQGPGFAIGANGLVVERDAVFVVNMDHATFLKIPRDASGHAGAPVVIAGPDCDTLGGADGLVRAPDGSFVIAVNRQNKLLRATLDGRLETIASGPPFDFPATVAYRGSTLYATNFALKNASAGMPAAPGLVKVGR